MSAPGDDQTGDLDGPRPGAAVAVWGDEPQHGSGSRGGVEGSLGQHVGFAVYFLPSRPRIPGVQLVEAVARPREPPAGRSQGAWSP